MRTNIDHFQVQTKFLYQAETLYLALKTLVHYNMYIITYRLFTSAKTDAEICHTYPCVQTDSGQLAFRFCGPLGDVRRATYLCLDCRKSMYTSWNINTLNCYLCELWPCVGRWLSRNPGKKDRVICWISADSCGIWLKYRTNFTRLLTAHRPFAPKPTYACHFCDAKCGDTRQSNCHNHWSWKGENNKCWQSMAVINV